MSDLRKALKKGVTFEITMAFSEPIITARQFGNQIFIQYGIKELNDFEQLEVAAQAVNRLLAEKQQVTK